MNHPETFPGASFFGAFFVELACHLYVWTAKGLKF